jgi:Protein of unknown function (DUF1638)
MSALDAAIEVRYLPANLHNRPEGIVPAVRSILESTAPDRPTFVAYGDCGTGGRLDALLCEFPGVARLPGAHCYEFFAGSDLFAALMTDEPGTFFLTDYLAKHFDALVWTGLGLDRHPELRGQYFANYRRVVHLAQTDDATIAASARQAADRLGLRFESFSTGRQHFAASIPFVEGVGPRVRA